MPSGTRPTASTRQKAAKEKSPKSSPRSTPSAAPAPCTWWPNAVRMAAKSGYVASSPLQRAPSRGASAVSARTTAVASTMRAGRSQGGGTAGVSRAVAAGMRRSESASAATTSANSAAGPRSSGCRIAATIA